jgi:hypothetical protein
MIQRIAYLVIALLVASIVMPGAAHASTYRFWNFWATEEDAWVYSPLGPASTFPANGSVQGWVFAATDADSESVQPSIGPIDAFGEACGTTTITEGQKRVALVIDSGSLSIAPEGQIPPTLVLACAVGSSEASGYELLNSISELRTENGFICAINSSPAMECSAAFTANDLGNAPGNTLTASSDTRVVESLDPQEQVGNSAAPIGTAVVISLIALAGFYLWRKRSS